MNKPRDAEAFRAEHDPQYEVNNPTQVYGRVLRKDVQVFIITAAQNATPVEKTFWGVLQCMAKMHNAELLVVPLRYKNPTSKWTGSQQNAEWWAPELRPYLWNVRHSLNKNLMLLADVKTQPTMSNPLTGIDALSHAASGIVGHTKLQLRSVATPSNRMAKILTTTGAVTVPNYNDARVGKLGEFHHSQSAIIVEVDGGYFALRHLHFDKKTGTVTDLNIRWNATGGEVAPRAEALVLGDVHVDYIDPVVKQATFGPRGLVPLLDPKRIVYHDLLDAYAVNGHHVGNPFNAIAKRKAGRDDARMEVLRAIDFVKEHTPKGCEAVVVSSNHDDMLRRWIVNADWKEDATNAEFYLETALHMVRNATLGKGGTEYPSPFPYWLKKYASDVRVLGGDESLVVCGVELGMHGDRGPNGARGSARNLRRIGVRSIIGHSHSPEIAEGCYQTGTSTRLRLEYNSGPSSWLNAHVVLNADGKRQLVIIVDGRFRHVPK